MMTFAIPPSLPAVAKPVKFSVTQSTEKKASVAIQADSFEKAEATPAKERSGVNVIASIEKIMDSYQFTDFKKLERNIGKEGQDILHDFLTTRIEKRIGEAVYNLHPAEGSPPVALQVYANKFDFSIEGDKLTITIKHDLEAIEQNLKELGVFAKLRNFNAQEQYKGYDRIIAHGIAKQFSGNIE